jgi:hypothetical protein
MPNPGRILIEEHLRTNHIPPIPAAFADAAIAAIEAIEAGDDGRLIDYGAGLTANGRAADTASDIADAMHLWDMIDWVDRDLELGGGD